MERLLRQNFWVVHVLVIAICAGFAGRAAAHLLTASFLVGTPVATRAHHAAPAREKPRNKDGTTTLARNIFCSACAPAKETPGPSGADDGAPRPTSLSLELVSTLIAPSEERWSMAIMRDLSTREKDPAMYNKGSSIPCPQIIKVLPR